MKYTLNHYTIFLLGVLISCMGLYAVMAIPFGGPSVVIKNPKSVAVEKEMYRPGDRITYTLDYCKRDASPAKVYRILVNSIRISYTEITSDLPVGCRTININDLVIPEFVPDGIYHIETTTERQVNIFRKELVTWRSEDFRVETLKPLPELILQVEENDERLDKLEK